MKKLLFLTLVMSITGQMMAGGFALHKDAPLESYIQMEFNENPKPFDVSYSPENTFETGELVVVNRPFHSYIDEITGSFFYKKLLNYRTKLGAMDTAEKFGKIKNLPEIKTIAEKKMLENKKK